MAAVVTLCFFAYLSFTEKNVKFIYFKKRTDSCEEILRKHSILTVYELHVYELIKFSLKAISGLQFCNDLLVPYTIERETRESAIKLLKQPLCKRKIERCSIKFRAIKLYNKLKSLEIIPADFEAKTLGEIAILPYAEVFIFSLQSRTRKICIWFLIWVSHCLSLKQC